MRRCPQCGVESPDQAKFCGNCGFIMRSESPSPQSAVDPVPVPFQERATPGVASEANQARDVYRPRPFQAPPPQPYPYSVPPVVPGARAQKRKSPLIFVGIGIVLVLVCVVAGLLWAQFTHGVPQLSIVSGKPAPGQPVTLKGEHFPVGSKLGVVVDSNPLILFARPANSAVISSSLLPHSLAEPHGAIYSVTAGLDGTFTLKVRIPASWKAGSRHTIVAQVIGDNPQDIHPVPYQLTVA